MCCTVFRELSQNEVRTSGWGPNGLSVILFGEMFSSFFGPQSRITDLVNCARFNIIVCAVCLLGIVDLHFVCHHVSLIAGR